MRKIILASHGNFSQGLADTKEMIIGKGEELETYSLIPGESASTFAEELSKEISDNRETEYVILTDLYGASVCMAMSSLVQYPNVKLFTGMNLPMLLAICTEYTEDLSAGNIEEIVEEARQGIRYIDAGCFTTENDEF